MPLIEDAFAALADIRAAFDTAQQVGCHVFIYSPSTRARREKWHRISMVGAVSAKLAEVAISSLIKIERRAADDSALAEFDFDAMADGNIGVLRVADAPAISDWLEGVPSDDWPALFSGDEGVLDSVRFYATRLNLPDGRNLTIFRGSRGLNVAIQSRNSIIAAFSRDTHQMIEISGPIISFDGQIDFFEWDGTIFISNLPTFESVTNIREITIKRLRRPWTRRAHDLISVKILRG